MVSLRRPASALARTRPRLGALAGAALLLASACEPPSAVSIRPIARSSIAVSSTLRLPIAADNPAGAAIVWGVEAPPALVAFESVASIAGTPSGAELRYTPLASHVGSHVLTVVARSLAGAVLDQATAVVEVTPAEDAAPVFLAPGAGGTYDLARDPCVRFRVEIRDDDSPGVEIRARAPLPPGATLAPAGPKSADFDWCPASDQIAASERWTIELEADDGDHAPVPHDYVVVLRSGGGGCGTGAAPVVGIRMPTEAERVTSSTGYEVTATVTDDRGLRDAPLLYWTTETPPDRATPDVTSFEQLAMEDAGGGTYRARIPSLGLAEGAEAEVFYLVSATDNDDAEGTACDHRTDSPLVAFYAVGGAGGTGVAECSTCTASIECGAGSACVPASGGARCLRGCDPTTGGCAGGRTCQLAASAEGSLELVCGTVAAVCGGGSTSCTEDAGEPDDSIAEARPLSGGTARGQICSGDPDYYRFDATMSDEIVVTLSGFAHAAGDLDLRLLTASGAILGTSASTSDMERVTTCARETGPIYAHVLGYRMASNPYTLTVARTPDACCVDDAFEPDDALATARPAAGGSFEGTICPMDADHIAIPIAGASTVDITVTFDAARSDIDIELFDPSGVRIASSAGTTDTETITRMVTTSGTYVLRVFGFTMESNTYLGEVIVTPASTCASTLACPAGEVCGAGTCRADDCTTAATCPPMHLCPDPGPSTAPSDCAASCTVNTECRSTEACKWFAEGRACGARGAGANGDACASFRECGGQRACLDWPGGYCARAGCRTNADCETGTYCASYMGASACLLDCASDATRCRAPSYGCRNLADRGGTSRRLCAP